MAIFSRRTIQRLINENASLLTRKQIKSLVDKLNKGDLGAEWKVVLVSVFSKLGKVEHERNFGFGTVNQVMMYFEKGKGISGKLEDFLSNLHKRTEEIFPYPIKRAINAINSLEQTRLHSGDSHFGGATMSGNEIKLSSRTVLDLLSGRITYDVFPETYKDFIKRRVSEGRVFEAVKIEKDTTEQDDDWLVLKFGEPDPSVTASTVPRREN